MIAFMLCGLRLRVNPFMLVVTSEVTLCFNTGILWVFVIK